MYNVLCEIAGHAANGMTASLMIGDAGSGAAAAAATPTTMSWQQMDAMMADVARKFPAKTEGHGGDLLAPKVLADGTKEFDIEAKIVKWEVSPGKLVDAWTYNGVVPAPEIHVNDGDKVRIVLTNNLPESTSLHLHGIRSRTRWTASIPTPSRPSRRVRPSPTSSSPRDRQSASTTRTTTPRSRYPTGMFGAFTIDEMPISQVLKDKGYTKVDKKVNMVLNDAGTIGLSLNGKSFPATEPTRFASVRSWRSTTSTRVCSSTRCTSTSRSAGSSPKTAYRSTCPRPAIPSSLPRASATPCSTGQRSLAFGPGTVTFSPTQRPPTGMFGMVTALIVEE